MGTGVQCVLQRMHNMTAESPSGALHSEREMCYKHMRHSITIINEITIIISQCITSLSASDIYHFQVTSNITIINEITVVISQCITSLSASDIYHSQVTSYTIIFAPADVFI